MRVPLRRAGIATVVVAAVALVAFDVTLLHHASSPPSASAGAARQPEPSLTPAGSHDELSSAAGRSSPEPGPSTSSHANATARIVVPPAVTVAGVAALPSAHVHAGYATPADAVEAFYQALLGGTPTQACAYATSCPAFGSGRITGSVNIVDAISHGDEALVEITGTICRAATCVPLTDRVLMPTGSASFNTAWVSLTAGVYGWAGSPLPCVRDAATGQWHVKLS